MMAGRRAKERARAEIQSLAGAAGIRGLVSLTNRANPGGPQGFQWLLGGSR